MMKKTTTVFFAACVSIANVFAQSRVDTVINNGWEFSASYGGGKTNAGRTVVDLPHTWNKEEIRSNKSEYSRGAGFYSKTLLIDKALEGRRVFLKFEAVSLVAQVFVNNAFVGEHQGAYTAFCFEITPFVEYGKENTVRVHASNGWRPDVMPLSGDFNVYGGIYRPVHLIVTDQTCISPLDYASCGIYLTQSRVSQHSARLEVTTRISNAGGKARKILVKTLLTDMRGRTVEEKTSPVQLDVNTTTSKSQTFDVAEPHLWNGKDDPYLYRVRVQLMSGGSVLDEITQPVGFRFFHTDPQKGFFLNGKYLDLHGVSRHQDRMGRGNALLVSDHQEDVSLMMEMGANIVRLAHYPQSQYFISLCDSTGLIVWSELPFVNVYAASPPFEANGEQQLREMVCQLYNHPSIIFWGLFNELRLNQADPGRYLAKLQAAVKTLDTQRLTVAATNLSAPFDGIPDVIAWNRYFGWYVDVPTRIAGWLDSIHAGNPSRCVGLSEYGAGASVVMHAEAFDRPVEPRGEWHPEEWQNYFHEVHWQALKSRPYVWCKIIWNMFDFASAGRKEGDIDGRNDKGLIGYDHKTRKDAFWFYKANWSEDPVLHMVGKTFRVRERNPLDIKVYSNLDTVELSVNGNNVGSARGNTVRVFEWKGVPLRYGNNVVQIRGLREGQPYTDSCVWWCND